MRHLRLMQEVAHAAQRRDEELYQHRAMQRRRERRGGTKFHTASIIAAATDAVDVAAAAHGLHGACQRREARKRTSRCQRKRVVAVLAQR